MANLTRQAQIKPDQIIEIVFRYKWLIICLLAVVLTIGLVKTLTATRIYRATTMILVQPQEVPSNYVRSVVTTGIEERLSTISQEILSRTNLEKIINQFDLYKNQDDMYLEDKIDNLRNRIDVTTTGSSRRRQGSVTFAIQFTGSKPEQVMQITNTLASFFMDENLKTRETMVEGTTEFLNDELEKIKKTLEIQETDIAKYRSNYVGGLPNELDSNLRTLDRLQIQLTDNQILLREAINNEILLQQRIIRQKAMPDQTFEQASNGSGNTNRVTTDENELSRLKGELRDLLLKYTEKHPDVVKSKNTIKKLEKKIEHDNKTQVSGGEELFSTDPEVMELEMQLKQVENSIPGLTSDVQAIKDKIESLEKLVEQTPKREQELQKLQRDYSSTKDVYASILDRRLEAELSVSMEKKQKADKFRVLDYAIRPEKPISPNVRNSFFIYFGAGCALAGGIIYLLFVFDNAVRRKEDIVDTFGLPILVEIGAIEQPGHKFMEKMNALALIVASSYIIAIIGVFMMLESRGIERSINLIKSSINF